MRLQQDLDDTKDILVNICLFFLLSQKKVMYVFFKILS